MPVLHEAAGKVTEASVQEFCETVLELAHEAESAGNLPLAVSILKEMVPVDPKKAYFHIVAKFMEDTTSLGEILAEVKKLGNPSLDPIQAFISLCLKDVEGAKAIWNQKH